MVASPTMHSILEFTQGLTVNKTAEFLRLLPGLKPADAPKSPWYLDKAKKFLTRTLEERTYKLKETVHIKKRKKDKEKVRRAARATVSAPAAGAAAAPKEPPVLGSDRLHALTYAQRVEIREHDFVGIDLLQRIAERYDLDEGRWFSECDGSEASKALHACKAMKLLKERCKTKGTINAAYFLLAHHCR